MAVHIQWELWSRGIHCHTGTPPPAPLPDTRAESFTQCLIFGSWSLSEQLNLVEDSADWGGAALFGLFRLCRSPVPLPLSGTRHMSTRDTSEAQNHPGRSFPPPHPEGTVLGRVRCSRRGKARLSKGTRAQKGRRQLITSNVEPRLPTANAVVKSLYPRTSLDTCIVYPFPEGEAAVAWEFTSL